MNKPSPYPLPILNRDWAHPADGWYQIERAGNHPNARAGVVQIIDQASCQSIVNKFNAEADKPGFAGMLIDHEHFKHDEKEETRAYGWLMRLQNRDDGIYGQIRWTDTGRAAVDGGDYRFFSTEYAPADLEVLNKTKPKKVRPLRLDGLTLTNVNNNKGQKPITNRNPMAKDNADPMADTEAANTLSAAANDGDSPDLHQAAAAAHEKAAQAHEDAAGEASKAGDAGAAKKHLAFAKLHEAAAENHEAECQPAPKNRFPTGPAGTEHQQTQDPVKMKTVIAELKLPADASEPDVLAAVKKITNRASELETVQIESDLETYQDRYPAAQKEFIKSLLVTNRAGTVEYLKAQPAITHGRALAPRPVHNRNTAAPVDASAGGETAEDEVKRVDAINDEINTLRAQNRDLTYDQARNSIRNRKPELFGLQPRA